jgi:hypothetical protein
LQSLNKLNILKTESRVMRVINFMKAFRAVGRGLMPDQRGQWWSAFENKAAGGGDTRNTTKVCDAYDIMMT